jgi:hypothetical protein
MSKDAGLRIRIDRILRDRFLQTCHAQDKPAAQVLREFMRGYVADHQNDKASNDTAGSAVSSKRIQKSQGGKRS